MSIIDENNKYELPVIKKEFVNISNQDSMVTVNEIPQYEVRLIKNVYFEDLLKRYGSEKFPYNCIGGH